jgi:hypothetical protein
LLDSWVKEVTYRFAVASLKNYVDRRARHASLKTPVQEKKTLPVSHRAELSRFSMSVIAPAVSRMLQEQERDQDDPNLAEAQRGVAALGRNSSTFHVDDLAPWLRTAFNITLHMLVFTRPGDICIPETNRSDRFTMWNDLLISFSPTSLIDARVSLKIEATKNRRSFELHILEYFYYFDPDLPPANTPIALVLRYADTVGALPLTVQKALQSAVRRPDRTIQCRQDFQSRPLTTDLSDASFRIPITTSSITSDISYLSNWFKGQITFDNTS